MLVTVLIALAVAPFPAAAADMPCLTARLIVPWGAGSGTDLLFRALADAANGAGAKPRLEVVNFSGEEGVRGAREARAAPPDGCTLLAVHQSLMASYIDGQANFGWDAFTPVARLTRTPVLIGARADAPFGTVTEMLAAARGPAGVTAASTKGLASHFLFLQIADRTGVTFRPVFLDGTRERLTALLSGTVDIGDINFASAQRHVASGALKALAVTGAEREEALPMIPTLREQGVDLVFAIDRGIMLPKAAKPELVEHYAKLFEAALADPRVAGLMEQHGTSAGFLGPKAYAGYWQDSFADWRRIAKEADLYRQAD